MFKRNSITFFSQFYSQYVQTKVKFERRRQGIEPEMPPIEERESIKAEYMKTKQQL